MSISKEPPAAAVDGRLIAGRYRLAGQLGTGGMGAVWAGSDVLVGREVALKEAHFPPHLAADSKACAGRVERMLREARAAARIDHPAVVTIHDVITHDGRPWIVMERVPGESLSDLLKRQMRLPVGESARIAGLVAQALDAAHASRVLHRDVKPANVLLGPAGRVVLTDFGIAHIEGEDPLTRSGEFIGSFEYAAPERLGGHTPGTPSDLWSLGVMLFQMIEGRSPFRHPTVEATVAAVLTAKVPRPSRAAVGLAPLVTALLERDPANRPTAAEAADALHAVTRQLPARREANSRVPQAPSAPGADGGGLSHGRGPSRRRLAAGVLAAVVTAAVLTALAVDKSRGDGEAGPIGPTAKATARHRPSPSRTSPPPPATAGYVRAVEKPFAVEIPDGWHHQGGRGPAGKYVFTQGAYQLVVVAGRDPLGPYKGDPVAYQTAEPELAAFRASEWSDSWGLDDARIGGRAAALGTYSWKDSTGHGTYAKNTVLIVGTRFHVILVTGPDTKNGRALVSRVAGHAAQTYTPAT